MGVAMEKGARLRDAAGRAARHAAARRAVSAGASGKRAQTQALLLEAGRELFAEQGIGATSVGDLCSRAGFTRGAFYSNFADMDHFVRQAVDEALPDSAERSPASSDDEVQHALEILADRLLLAMPVSREFYMLQNEFVSYILRNQEHAQGLRRSYEAFKASLREVVVTGLGAIGRECMLSADDMTELLFAAAERSMRTALMVGREDQLTALLDRSLPVMLTHMSRPRES